MSHRFFVAPDGLTREQSRQIATVLRLRPGEIVTLVREGEELDFRLDRVSADGVDGVVVARRPVAGEPTLTLTLALPILKGDRSEEIVEAATQIGVAQFVPFVSARSVVRELTPGKKARWTKIAQEAAEVARRGRVPAVTDAVTWAALVELLAPPVVVCWEEERDARLPSQDAGALSLVVGPEGGLEAEEVAVFRERGARIVTLGPRPMRAETAAIAAVSALLLELR